MGCFYTGFGYKDRKNGHFKIGETGKSTPAERLGQIRQKETFMCLGYVILKGDTKADRLFIESYVRAKLSKEEDLTHIQNDHFLYKIKGNDEKYTQAYGIANRALNFAMEACKMQNIEYSLGTKTYKRG
jgi:hypothetical protein